jgi:hypothetical protein
MNLLDKPPIPEISILPSTEGQFNYKVDWDEFHRWAMRNHTLWASVYHRLEFESISEMDKLKIVAYELLKQNEQQRRTITHHACTSRNTFVIPGP